MGLKPSVTYGAKCLGVPPQRKQVNTSRMHQSLVLYVVPAAMSSRMQPAR
jgi:hypothetical protein